jgi:hypothetical protein
MRLVRAFEPVESRIPLPQPGVDGPAVERLDRRSAGDSGLLGVLAASRAPILFLR